MLILIIFDMFKCKNKMLSLIVLAIMMQLVSCVYIKAPTVV
jgi:hypothetical protein